MGTIKTDYVNISCKLAFFRLAGFWLDEDKKSSSDVTNVIIWLQKFLWLNNVKSVGHKKDDRQELQDKMMKHIAKRWDAMSKKSPNMNIPTLCQTCAVP